MNINGHDVRVGNTVTTNKGVVYDVVEFMPCNCGDLNCIAGEYLLVNDRGAHWLKSNGEIYPLVERANCTDFLAPPKKETPKNMTTFYAVAIGLVNGERTIIASTDADLTNMHSAAIQSNPAAKSVHMFTFDVEIPAP